MKKAYIVLFNLIVLMMLVCVQNYFLIHSVFRKLPYVGHILHFIGGGAVYVLAIICIRFYCQLIAFKSTIKWALLVVVSVECCWELIEVLLGWNDRQQLSYYLYNTAEDIIITAIGALFIALIELRETK